MRMLVAALLVLLICASAQAREPDDLRQLADRAAITEVMQKYIWSVDSLDAEGYVSVFTEDAVIDANGDVHKGHDEIRKVVTSLQELQARNRAAGKPPGNLYHVISNERIAFTSPTEALYQSYWQTLRKGTENRYIAGGFGRSEDHLVKRDGHWLIKYRKLVVFTD
ncbi:MAG TPA: nuclear transport factor 2 family protein [Steroidobacteraceae bacterium]|nr:nuclear transport factor 2 family protein [Steroidobacteraceae bacterium]